jgi:hypothetical protein
MSLDRLRPSARARTGTSIFDRFDAVRAIAGAGEISASEAAVLTQLVIYAGDDGLAYPSVETLATGTAWCEKTVRRSILALIAKGYLRRSWRQGSRTTPRYMLCLPSPVTVTNEEKGSPVTVTSEESPSPDTVSPSPDTVSTVTGHSVHRITREHSFNTHHREHDAVAAAVGRVEGWWRDGRSESLARTSLVREFGRYRGDGLDLNAVVFYATEAVPPTGALNDPTGFVVSALRGAAELVRSGAQPYGPQAEHRDSAYGPTTSYRFRDGRTLWVYDELLPELTGDETREEVGALLDECRRRVLAVEETGGSVTAS